MPLIAPFPISSVSLTLTFGPDCLFACCLLPTLWLQFREDNPFSLCSLETLNSFSDSGKNLFVSCILGDVTQVLTLSLITLCCFGLAPSSLQDEAFWSLQSFGKDIVSLRFKMKVAGFSPFLLKVTVGFLPPDVTGSVL